MDLHQSSAVCGIEYSASGDFFQEAYEEANLTHLNHHTPRCDYMGLGEGNGGCDMASATSTTLDCLFIKRALSAVNLAITKDGEQIDRVYLEAY